MSNIKWSFEGQTVLITGASRGIGRACADLFAEAGAEVFTLSRTARVGPLHPAITEILGSVTDPAAVVRVVGAASARGDIDICVANAGMAVVEEFEASGPAWEQVFKVNVEGVAETWRAVLPHIGKSGRLIVTSSGAGVRGEADLPAYSAAKASLGGLVHALALAYASRGMTVNAVAPGEIDTEMNWRVRASLASARGLSSEGIAEGLLAEGIPLGRLGTPEEVAALVCFLASDEAAYITGQVLLIDGGQLLT